ncbi:hypothetical protein QZH41_009644, partial [Actinostola sp. cb2023]
MGNNHRQNSSVAYPLQNLGDGRTYALNIQPDSIRLDDLHQSFLYTREDPTGRQL